MKLPDYIPSFTSCYETLYQQEELIEPGFPLPTSILLRKALVSVKKGKCMFSIKQLLRVVRMIMDNKSYLLFRPKSDTKDYVILVFWSTNFDDTLCSIQENTEVIKKEVLADGYQLWFKVENIPSPRIFSLYMLNNYITFAVQNDNEYHLPPVDHKQLESFLTLLEANNITTPKKRKLSDTVHSTVSALPLT